MSEPRLEQVFKISGIPTYTFVKPIEYPKLLVALRTPGRGVVVEGPSGIGKTTSVTNALRELSDLPPAISYSARRAADLDAIRKIPGGEALGVVLIDDFHKLDESTAQAIADYMKLLADEERADVKIVILGINKAGESLVRFAHDLNNRIEVIRFEANPDEKVRDLLELGESALNIKFNIKSEIINSANGGFYIAQMLRTRLALSQIFLSEGSHWLRPR